jgi:hypothetical protein
MSGGLLPFPQRLDDRDSGGMSERLENVSLEPVKFLRH